MINPEFLLGKNFEFQRGYKMLAAADSLSAAQKKVISEKMTKETANYAASSLAGAIDYNPR